MKRLFFFFMILFALVWLNGCDQTTDNQDDTENQGAQQIFLVWAEHYTVHNYTDALDKTNADSTSTTAYGVIIANVIPQFNFAKFNDYSFTHGQYYSGYIAFGDEFDDQTPLPDFGAISPLNFEGNTSIGSVSGSITLPDTLQNIQTSVSNKLPKGQSLTITWSGSNADFYSINGEYEWFDNDYNWHYIDLDTMIATSSVIYDGTLFQHDGRIRIYNIVPTNGPLPQAGAQANLDGDGSGFLYYANSRKDIDITIDVGNGISYAGLRKAPLQKDVSAKLAKVRAMLGL